MERVYQVVADGADILDVGWAKAAPGAFVDVAEEIDRTACDGPRSASGAARRTSCQSLVRAMLDRASRGWRGLAMIPPDYGCCTTCAGYCSATHPAPTTSANRRRAT